MLTVLTWDLHVERNKRSQINERHAPEEQAPGQDGLPHLRLQLLRVRTPLPPAAAAAAAAWPSDTEGPCASKLPDTRKREAGAQPETRSGEGGSQKGPQGGAKRLPIAMWRSRNPGITRHYIYLLLVLIAE